MAEPAAGQSRFSLSGTELKVIAAASMLTDHMGAVLFPQLLFLRVIGRLAFPIYCFLLAEGAVHTHNMKKYLLRLGLFAFASEIPFDLAFRGSFFAPDYQNVFFTLLLGMLMICLAGNPPQKLLGALTKDSMTAQQIWNIIVLIIFALAAQLLKTDYGAAGVIMIFFMYMFRDNAVMRALGVVLCCLSMGMAEMPAIASLLFIWRYNGRRGWQPQPLQIGFYAYYPVHLLILSAIAGNIPI